MRHVLGAEERPCEAYIYIGERPAYGVAPQCGRKREVELAAEELMYGKS